jgi:hypothetical protein
LKNIDIELEEENKFWKVITQTAAFGAHSGFNSLFIGNPNTLHSSSYVSFKISSKEEAQSLKSYLETDIVNILLSLRKISQTISNQVDSISAI